MAMKSRAVHVIPVMGFDEAMVQAICDEILRGESALGGEDGGIQRRVVSASTVRHLGFDMRATTSTLTVVAHASSEDWGFYMVIALNHPVTYPNLIETHVTPAIVRVQTKLMGIGV